MRESTLTEHSRIQNLTHPVFPTEKKENSLLTYQLPSSELRRASVKSAIWDTHTVIKCRVLQKYSQAERKPLNFTIHNKLQKS